MALSMVKEILDERKKPAEILELVFPMTKDELNNRKLWVENAAIVAAKAKKGDVAFITLGRPDALQHFSVPLRMRKRNLPRN